MWKDTDNATKLYKQIQICRTRGYHSGADEGKTPCIFDYKIINIYHAK
jgi:hypothetical protein